jgi:2-dehydro-3-deoxygalactonokinase
MSDAALIAIDWGTTRFRAYLLNNTGVVLDRVESHDGIMAVKPGGFPAVLAIRCGSWLARHADVLVIMAGMVGSRNGWIEAPYRACPTTAHDLAGAMQNVDIGNGRLAQIIPGCSYRDTTNTPDVMRGEETLAFGTHCEDGIIILPGTHSKWVVIEHGVITQFATFMTGEIYAVLLNNTILGTLKTEPIDPAGFQKGLAAAKREGGLTHHAFAARTSVLLGDMDGACVAPFLSGLVVGTEIRNALARFGTRENMILVAEGPIAESYREACAASGLSVTIKTPETCLIDGMALIASRR